MTRTSGFDRTAYNREYARRRRAARVALLNAGAATCQASRGRDARCGGVLTTTTDGNGGTVTICPLCERKRRGCCRECGRPVAGQVGKALRCAYHAEIERARASERCRLRDPERHRRGARRVYQRDAEKRRKRNEYKRAWRKANPEKVKAYKRREALTQNPRRLAYHQKRRDRERTELATRERARYHGVVELRTCVTPRCDIVVTGRKKKCTKCRERDRIAAVALLAQRVAA
jgi:hypothetical protein